MTGGLSKEHGTNNPPSTGRIWERSGEATCPTNLPESSLLESILAEQCLQYQEGLSQNDWADTTQKLIPSPQTQDCEPRGRAVLLDSLNLLCSTGMPLSNKISCFINTCVSSNNSFPSVSQEPPVRPWKGSPFLEHFYGFVQIDDRQIDR